MPNWCDNTITISGPRDKIRTLMTLATTKKGLLNAMVPQPDNIFLDNLGQKERELCKSQGIPNWYDWNVANWGTKWDVDTDGLEFNDLGDGTAEIAGYFESAWAPPVTAYFEFLKQNPDCDIAAYYYEPGMDFAGIFRDCDDNETSGLYEQYKESEEQWSDLFRELEEHYNLGEQFEQYEEEEL